MDSNGGSCGDPHTYYAMKAKVVAMRQSAPVNLSTVRAPTEGFVQSRYIDDDVIHPFVWAL